MYDQALQKQQQPHNKFVSQMPLVVTTTINDTCGSDSTSPRYCNSNVQPNTAANINELTYNRRCKTHNTSNKVKLQAPQQTSPTLSSGVLMERRNSMILLNPQIHSQAMPNNLSPSSKQRVRHDSSNNDYVGKLSPSISYHYHHIHYGGGATGIITDTSSVDLSGNSYDYNIGLNISTNSNGGTQSKKSDVIIDDFNTSWRQSFGGTSNNPSMILLGTSSVPYTDDNDIAQRNGPSSNMIYGGQYVCNGSYQHINYPYAEDTGKSNENYSQLSAPQINVAHSPNMIASPLSGDRTNHGVAGGSQHQQGLGGYWMTLENKERVWCYMDNR